LLAQPHVFCGHGPVPGPCGSELSLKPGNGLLKIARGGGEPPDDLNEQPAGELVVVQSGRGRRPGTAAHGHPGRRDAYCVRGDRRRRTWCGRASVAANRLRGRHPRARGDRGFGQGDPIGSLAAHLACDQAIAFHAGKQLGECDA
jgi:hypothetical protein